MRTKKINLLNLFFLFWLSILLSSCIMLPRQTATLHEDVYQTKLGVESLGKKLNSYNENMNQSLKTLSEENSISAKTTNKNLADLNERVLKIEENVRNLQAKIDELVFYISKESPQITPSDEGVSVTPTASTQASLQTDMLQGKKFFNQGEYQKAIDVFNNILTRNPSTDIAAEAYYHIGQSYFYLNDFDNAIKNFTQILTNYPEEGLVPYSMLRIGDCYLKLNNVEEAKKRYQEVLNKYPDFKEAELIKAKLEEIK